MSSKLSGTYLSALNAKQSFDNVKKYLGGTFNGKSADYKKT